MVTIKDIAHRAGVSCTTVSNVVNGRAGRVSPTTVERINEIIKDTGYVPNLAARSLVYRTSKMVAVINRIPSARNGELMADPFRNQFIGAVESAMRHSGYYLMLRTVDSAEELKAFLTNWSLDGLFMVGVYEDEFFEMLSKIEKPIVLADNYLNSCEGVVNVGIEDFQGGYLATRYLIEHGHSRIAFACQPFHEVDVFSERLRGYRRAIEEAGLPFEEDLLFEVDFGTQSALEMGTHLAGRKDITAVFAPSDLIAAGIMAGLQQHGRMVPDDISVIGFDDIDWCRLMRPTLTTVRQDAEQKGQMAAELMIRMLEDNPPLMRRVVLPVSIKERESVRRL